MHVMLDIETLGTRPGCVVTQVGMARFDNSGVKGVPLLFNIDIGDQLAVGLDISQETVNWWRRQKQSTINFVLSPTNARFRLYETLNHIKEFLQSELANERFSLWANPDWFDLPVLAEVYHRCGREYPWPRRQTSDARTLLKAAGFTSDNRTRPQFAHTANGDANAQAMDVVAAANKLGMSLR